jgi:AcrR family transcriptional regulator
MVSRVGDFLDARRPHRADAARNFDAIIEAGRELFAEFGTDVFLADVAARAGVGIATLYRHFPTREDLAEAVYVAEVDALCTYGDELAETHKPGLALDEWIRRFVTYMATKRALLTALDRDSGAFVACKAALYESGGPLLISAQQAGIARDDVNIDDVMRFIIGVTSAPFGSDEQRDRILRLAVDAVHRVPVPQHL